MKRDDIPFRLPDHQAASATAAAAFALLPFPISREEAIEAIGDRLVPLADGRHVPLGRLLMNAPIAGFESPEDASRAVDRHWGRMAAGLTDEDDESA